MQHGSTTKQSLETQDKTLQASGTLPSLQKDAMKIPILGYFSSKCVKIGFDKEP